MAHELSIRKDGTVEAAFARQKPWHGLGTQVEELMTPQEALEAAHLEWQVELRPIYLERQDGGLERVEDRVAAVRGDEGTYLGTVGTGYQPFQNRDQAAFIEALTSESEATVECVGALREGRKTFWTVRIPGNLVAATDDEVERYLILANAHDGTMAFRAFWSPIRVVCQNTLAASFRKAQRKHAEGVSEMLTVYHTSNLNSNIEQAKRVLGVADDYYRLMGQSIQRMVGKSLNASGFEQYLRAVYPVPETKRSEKIQEKKLSAIRENYQREPANGTVWGAYNAVTEYLTHERPMYQKDQAKRRERRMERLTWGDDAQMRQKAFDQAMAVAAIG